MGWQTTHPKKKVALISPQHFLTADHFRAGETITFFDASNTLRTFGVARIARIHGDIAIGTLEVPVPEAHGISSFPVIAIDGDGPWGREVYYLGNGPKGSMTFSVGRTGFEAAVEGMAQLDSELVTGKAYRDRVRGVFGDSGGPSFFLVEGELILIGHHYTTYQDILLGAQAEAVNAHLANAGYALDLRGDPGCGAGIGQGTLATLALVGWRRRRHAG